MDRKAVWWACKEKGCRVVVRFLEATGGGRCPRCLAWMVRAGDVEGDCRLYDQILPIVKRARKGFSRRLKSGEYVPFLRNPHWVRLKCVRCGAALSMPKGSGFECPFCGKVMEVPF